MNERLVIVPEVTLTVYDRQYMHKVLDSCLSQPDPYTIYRNASIGRLFYGILHRHDRMRVVDTYGLGRERLLGVLCSVGRVCVWVDALCTKVLAMP